jgi:hypothetical protein
MVWYSRLDGVLLVADDGRFGGGQLVVEVFDQLDSDLRSLVIQLVEFLARQHDEREPLDRKNRTCDEG